MLTSRITLYAGLSLTVIACGDGTTAREPNSPFGGGGNSMQTGGEQATGGMQADPVSNGGSNSTTETGGSGNDNAAGTDATGGSVSGEFSCPEGALLCEDFEAASLDLDIWETRGTEPVPDDTRAADGERSLHVHREGNGMSYIQTTSFFPVPNNTYYGRMMVWIEELPTAPNYAHWTIAEAAGSGNGSWIRVGGQLNGQQLERWGVGSDGGPTGDWTWHDKDPEGSVQEPIEKDWVCVEWLHDGENNETRLWLDDVEHESLHTTASDHGGNQGAEYLMPKFESVWIGWWLYQSDPTPASFDLWIDSVIFHTERIGCGG